MKRTLFLLIWIGLAITAFPQGASTKGKEFWLSFMQNGYYENTSGNIVEGAILQLTVSAKNNCQVSVTNPSFPDWSMSFQVQANSISEELIPKQYCYHMGTDNESVCNKGIHIVSTDTISVYCTNIANYSFDASFVLPIDGLGNDYIVQCGAQSTLNSYGMEQFKVANQTSAFLIVATEDNTTVHITPTVTTLGEHAAGVTFPITLNAGQTYHVRSNNTEDNRDLSGSRVYADDCKKIAVFNGNTLTRIPVDMSGSSGFDHVFEQAMPIRSWGKRFVVTQSMTRNRDIVKIVSSANGNVIRKNGSVITTLNANQSYSFDLTSWEASCYLESSLPCAVYLFNTSAGDGKANGDPSMVWIAPIEQCINDMTFATFTHYNASIDYHHVNIIVKAEDAGIVYLDGNLIPASDFNAVNGNHDYKYTRKNIHHGSHHISCAHGFNAHVYGFGDAKGYAYLVGSNAIDLSTSLTLNDLNVHSNEVFPYCTEEAMTFSAEVNLQDYQLLWNFGDGTTSNQNPVTHIYHEKRVFEASLIVTTDDSGCDASASDTTLVYIDATQQYITENDFACQGQYYSGFGFSNILIHNDTLLTRQQPNLNNPQCDDSLLLYLHAYPSYHIPLTDSRCWTGMPGVYDNYGFSFEYNEPNTYHRELYLTSVHGCDSVILLDLTVAARITHDFNAHSCTGSYEWDGRIYNEEGDYEWPYISLDGCDSIVTMHLTLGMTQTTSFDTLSCGSFIWNGHTYSTGGTYEQTLLAIDGCDSIVSCHLTIGEIFEDEPIFVTACDNYQWNNTMLTASGSYTDTLLSLIQCDSIVHLNLTLSHTPDPTNIQPVGNTTAPWVIPATEFQINSYEFILHDNNPECVWDSVDWQLCKRDPQNGQLVDNDINWRLLEKGALHETCKVYVLSHTPDTVWLRATAYNGCRLEGVHRDFWLLCSFYDIDEQESFFSIVPNPNNGQMTLRFENMTGMIELKVYDMSGALIDHFQVYNDTPSLSVPYDCKAQSGGLYLFVATWKDGTSTKKVTIF